MEGGSVFFFLDRRSGQKTRSLSRPKKRSRTTKTTTLSEKLVGVETEDEDKTRAIRSEKHEARGTRKGEEEEKEEGEEWRREDGGRREEKRRG